MLDRTINKMRGPGVKRGAVFVRLLQEGVSIKELERVAEKNPWLREELDKFEQHLRKQRVPEAGEDVDKEEERVHRAHLPETAEETEEEHRELQLADLGRSFGKAVKEGKISQRDALSIKDALEELNALSPSRASAVAKSFEDPRTLKMDPRALAINIRSMAAKEIQDHRERERIQDTRERLGGFVSDEVASRVRNEADLARFLSRLADLRKVSDAAAEGVLANKKLFEKGVDAEIARLDTTLSKLSAQKAQRMGAADIEKVRSRLLGAMLPDIGVGKEGLLVERLRKMSAKELALLDGNTAKQRFVTFAVNTSAGQVTVEKVRERAGIIEIKEGEGMTLDSEFTCPHCNNRGGYVRQQDTFADEPPITIHTCPKCKKVERSRSIF